MIVNGKALLRSEPIKNMLTGKRHEHGVTAGLGEAGYDICIKQSVTLSVEHKFILASAIEQFQMPTDLVGIVHDKSTWARRGLSVFNTVIEPGWNGFLTLELVYHGSDELIIPAGAAIAQVIFHRTEYHAQYTGKYQNQENKPVVARDSK